MSLQAGFSLSGRNPDVLTCIANLSNDEVFTPPELANRMLDTLAAAWAKSHKGANLWADKSVTFLDPCTKSGVFLREITRRLNEGLANEIPNLQKRVDHILTKQIFGIGITRLLILLHKPSQRVTRKVYTFVPKQDWSRKWTDEDLYQKYGITTEEIAFIEKVVRPLDVTGTPDDDA